MTLQTLGDLGDWKLEDDDQDIRGRPLLTVAGRQVGLIKDLVVDLENKRVSAVVTDQGEAYAVEGLEARPGSVVTHDGPISGGSSQPVSMRPETVAGDHAGLVRPG